MINIADMIRVILRTLPMLSVLLGVILLTIGLHELYKSSQTNSWMIVTGKLIKADLIVIKSSDGPDSYSVGVLYGYECAGKDYASTQLSFGKYVTKKRTSVMNY